MSSTVHIAGPIAYLESSSTAVYFSQTSAKAGTYPGNEHGTAAPVQKLQNTLNIAYWGEDNRFPQNIEQQMAYCGVGKAALAWKAAALYGNGIIPGKVIDYEDGGKKEIFKPLPRGGKYKRIYNYLEHRRTSRFFLEYFLDWTWFANCFPEACLSKDGKSITHFVHQESCDSRFVQMNDEGVMPTVYLSKLWGAGDDQWAKFDPKKTMRGLVKNISDPNLIDTKFLKGIDCVDMYDQVESLKNIAERLVARDGVNKFKSAIVPTNFPSPNKTYYQVPYWDGARLAGWIEIASKFPSLLKTLYNKSYRIKRHIKVPMSFFEQKYGFETWHGMDEKKQEAAKKKVLEEMDKFLSGEENSFKSFLSFYEVDDHTHSEYGKVEIDKIDDKTELDAEMLSNSAAINEILTAMQVEPTLFGAGKIGTGQQRSGGSDKRESYLIYCAQLYLERKVALEPIYVMRDYNREVGGMSEWEDDIEFRVRDTVLTTLDSGAGTTKVVS